MDVYKIVYNVILNVQKAKDLHWTNTKQPISFVTVTIGDKKYKSEIQHAIEPKYRQSFIFDLHVEVWEITHCMAVIAVVEPRRFSPKTLGEAHINLGTVWEQPSHKLFDEWLLLSSPKNADANVAAGYIKLDISINIKGEQTFSATLRNEKVIDFGPEYQRAKYLVTIYRAYSLPNTVQLQGHQHHGKPPSTFVKVLFGGLTAQTQTQQRSTNPRYIQQISLVQMFPSSSECIRLEVTAAESPPRVLASTCLKFVHVSHDGENGFLPTFGPSLLHMYSGLCRSFMTSWDEEPFYRGSLLVSLKTIVPFEQNEVGYVNVEKASPLLSEDLWDMENFIVICPIFEVSMLDVTVTGKSCGVAITVGEMFQDKSDKEFTKLVEDIKTNKLNYTGIKDVYLTTDSYGHLEFTSSFPALQLAVQLPDFRFRMYRNNTMQRIVDGLESTYGDVKTRFHDQDYTSLAELLYDLQTGLNNAEIYINKYLDLLTFSELNSKIETRLDENLKTLQLYELKKLLYSIKQITKLSEMAKSLDLSKNNIRNLLSEINCVLKALNSIVYKLNDGWPDIVIWIVNAGSRVAFCKIRASDIIHSVMPEQRGKRCGQTQTVFMKPIHCNKHPNNTSSSCVCFSAKIDLMLWMGVHGEFNEFDTYLPESYKLVKEDVALGVKCSSMKVECYTHICRAKLSNQIETTNKKELFVRINVLNSMKDTIPCHSSSPVWNQVLKIEKMMPISLGRLITNPPTAVIELCTEHEGKIAIIGSLQIQPVALENPHDMNVSELQWYELYNGVEYAGQILMNTYIFPRSEKALESILHSEVEEKIYYLAVNNNNNFNKMDLLPKNIIPEAMTYKVDVYWWGLRDLNVTNKPFAILEIDDTQIKSDIITKKNPNSNFQNGRKSCVLNTNLDESISPQLNINIYDASSFGRITLLCQTIKNPKKYVVCWFTKEQREKAMAKAIESPDFYQEKPKKLSRCFKKRVKEEEISLLPMCHRESCENERDLEESTEWWKRYCYSQKDAVINHEEFDGNKITIYDAKLELQKEFLKLKDWCSSIKLYNNKKDNEHEYIGQLKAGIAIYNWLPSEGTAVNCHGIDLKRGNFFDNYPDNEQSKFLVRVYVIKGINLETKDLAGKSCPYVTVSCGDMTLGNRYNCVPSSQNPVFCKLYEFRCSLPENYLVHVSVISQNHEVCDEIIGSTAIDLENRIYSKHRARVGLPSEYKLTGPTKWRDCIKPSAILEELCKMNHISPPKYPSSSSVDLNGVEYKYNDNDVAKISHYEWKENICLSLLRSWHTLPVCGYHLVPEHVETRNLFCEDNPGVSQGKIQMWVDIFPMDGKAIPPPVDITPIEPEDYHLVITVKNIHMAKGNTKKPLEAAVRIYFGNLNESLRTDIRIKNKLNWCEVFHFQYQFADSVILLKKSSVFGYEKSDCFPPILLVQVLDSNDNSTNNIVIGELMFNILSMPPGTSSHKQRNTHSTPMSKEVNLILQKNVSSWWPLVLPENSSDRECQVGSINLELKLLTTDEIKLIPAGNNKNVHYTLDARLSNCPFLIFKSYFTETKLIILLSFIILILLCVIGYNKDFTNLWYTLKRTFGSQEHYILHSCCGNEILKAAFKE